MCVNTPSGLFIYSPDGGRKSRRLAAINSWAAEPRGARFILAKLVLLLSTVRGLGMAAAAEPLASGASSTMKINSVTIPSWSGAASGKLVDLFAAQ